MTTTFSNGNTFSYTCGLRCAGSEAVFNLLEWSAEGCVYRYTLYQGLDTTAEMSNAKAFAYSQASGEPYVEIGGKMIPNIKFPSFKFGSRLEVSKVAGSLTP